MSKIEVQFKISTGVLILASILHIWLAQLTASDSEAWLSVKDSVCFVALALAAAGAILSVKVVKHAHRKALKYLSIIYILAFSLLALFSLLVLAVSGVGFLGEDSNSKPLPTILTKKLNGQCIAY